MTTGRTVRNGSTTLRGQTEAISRASCCRREWRRRASGSRRESAIYSATCQRLLRLGNKTSSSRAPLPGDLRSCQRDIGAGWCRRKSAPCAGEDFAVVLLGHAPRWGSGYHQDVLRRRCTRDRAALRIPNIARRIPPKWHGDSLYKRLHGLYGGTSARGVTYG